MQRILKDAGYRTAAFVTNPFLREWNPFHLGFVTSDHGRSLESDVDIGYGPAWRVNKKSMHEFNLRVPFVLLPSRRIPSASHLDTPCSNIDFTPTLLDLLGIRAPLTYPAESLADARRYATHLILTGTRPRVVRALSWTGGRSSSTRS